MGSKVGTRRAGAHRPQSARRCSAFQPEEEVERTFGARPSGAAPEYGLVDGQGLARDLAAGPPARSYAVDDEESEIGLRSVARRSAAIRATSVAGDHHRRPCAPHDQGKCSSWVRELVEVADAVSRAARLASPRAERAAAGGARLIPKPLPDRRGQAPPDFHV